jgi:hypothetical protein
MSQPFLFDIPQSIEDYLVVLDDFIEREIKPLEAQDDNIRFFDHRREHARTDWDRDGLPREDWEALLREMRRRADAGRALSLRAALRNLAGRMAVIWRWRASGSISPAKV